MKKITFLVCAFAYILMGTLSVNAQWQLTGLSGQTVLSIATIGSNIFAGTFSNGLFVSPDSGKNWTAVNNGLASQQINALAVSGTNIFAGTSDSGIFLSKDIGASWMAVNNGLTWHTDISALAISGKNIFAADGDIFLSTNNGESWIDVENGLPEPEVNLNSLAVGGGNIFVGTLGWGIYYSTDTGRNWISVDSNSIASLSDVRSFGISGTNVFAGTEFYGVFLSTDNGANWVDVNNNDLESPEIPSLAAIGTNVFAGTESIGIFLSADTGRSWTDVSYGLPWSEYGYPMIWSFDVNGTNIFAGTDTGVYKRSLSDILGIDNITAVNNSISIYPDPATNQLTIHSSSFQNEAVMVSVVNVLGQQTSPPAPLSRNAARQAQREEDAVIDVSKLSAGIYFLQLKSESGSVVKMFVKE